MRKAVVRLLGLSDLNTRLHQVETQLAQLPRPAPSHAGSANQSQSLEAFMALHNPYQYEYPIFLDYPVRPTQRFTPEHPHPLILAMMERQRSSYEHWIGEMAGLTNYFAAIPLQYEAGVESSEPIWLNGWFPGLDALVLYTLIAKIRPARYLEVGSGNSTKFARRAVRDQNLSTMITSIDPQPRAQVESICDRVMRTPLEDADLGIFGEMQAGDILMIDCSHRIFQGSDVTVLLLEVLPYLPAGVLVQFHDIHLPYDYPESWQRRYYSEQYGVATMLLADQGRRYEIVMANAFAAHDAPLQALLRATVMVQSPLEEIETHGGSLWLRVCGATIGSTSV